MSGKSDCLGVVLRGRQSHRDRADPESAEATDMASDARQRNRHHKLHATAEASNTPLKAEIKPAKPENG